MIFYGYVFLLPVFPFYYVYLLTEQLILPLSVNAHYTGRILVSSFIDIAVFLAEGTWYYQGTGKWPIAMLLNLQMLSVTAYGIVLCRDTIQKS